MKFVGAPSIARKVLILEWAAIVLIISILWIDEILDIPYVLLGGTETPINWRESLFESIIILCLGLFFIRLSQQLLARLDHLARLVPVCASCNKVCDEKEFWEIIEKSVEEYTKREFVYGMCPECVEKYYPEFYNEEALIKEKERVPSIGDEHKARNRKNL
ncbi:hypothetical protein [Desulfogranum japonicum]|uniref:hypothetical protein n=1 Tax=Desulfogranum japonicum TaxID=231447 RepID=UPI000418FA9A|nr:hypothetical protein [Desulfogranum japonicum]